jgi:hypothetical protein
MSERPYDTLPFWWDAASEEEKERVNTLVRPTPTSVVLSQNFPCPDCEAETPQAYLCDPEPDSVLEWLGEVGEWDQRVGRFMRCFVCNAVWAHHVGFKGYPGAPEQMSRVVPPPPSALKRKREGAEEEGAEEPPQKRLKEEPTVPAVDTKTD